MLRVQRDLGMPFHVSTRDFLMLWAGLACALAWWKGGPAERGGACLVALDWLVISLSQLAMGERTVTLNIIAIPAICSDLVLSAGFLFLALRYNSWWLGAAMIVQGVQLAVYGSFLAGGGHDVYAHAVAINVASWLLLDAIIGGTIASWWARSRSRRTPRMAIA